MNIRKDQNSATNPPNEARLRAASATTARGSRFQPALLSLLAAVATLSALCLSGAKPAKAQSGLQVSFGGNGLQKLSYNGVALEDLNAYPTDAFHIWHMKATDSQGHPLPGPQLTWGENNNGRSWNAHTHTWTYTFSWGTISTQYIQNGNNLDVVVTTSNNGNSGLVFDGASVYPLALHFPNLPAGFANAGYPQLTFNVTAPSVTTADYGQGEVVAVVPDATKALYSGFLPTGNGTSYTAFVSGTSPDSIATFQPHNDRPVAPGQSDQYRVSLRFQPSGTSTYPLAADAYRSWAATYPPVLHWTDRRAIGTVFLASSPNGDIHHAGGFPNNPRRYFNDGNGRNFDINTPDGLAAFQRKVVAQAQSNVTNLGALGAQGAITWDIEGEQFPQDTSYVCSPDQIAQLAPEMESVINDPSSPYHGMKLDDAYFQVMRSAGFRVGVCIRPQHFTLNSDGTAAQVFLPTANIAGELIRKINYAHDRWGATLFYIDSTVDPNGATLPASIFQQVAASVPDSLLIPEESTPLYFAYTAPFSSFIDLGATGTPSSVYFYYPHAFSAILINDVDPGKLRGAQAQLTTQVQHGDVLMGHTDYPDGNNPTIVSIYQSAGASGASAPQPTPAPQPVPPPAPAPPPDPAPAPGPPSASAPAASDPAPAAPVADTSAGASGPSSTDAATPAPVAPPAPANPAAPADPATAEAMPVSPPVAPENSSDLNIASPGSGQTVSGTILVSGAISDALDAAGSYLMVDGLEIGTSRITSAPYQYPLDTTTLSNGNHLLQLWAHDIGNNTLVSQTIAVDVQN